MIEEPSRINSPDGPEREQLGKEGGLRLLKQVPQRLLGPGKVAVSEVLHLLLDNLLQVLGLLHLLQGVLLPTC